MSCLRSLDLYALQAATGRRPFPGGTGDPIAYFLPIIDGDFSRDYLYNQFSRGEFIKVPLMVGLDRDEGTAFAPWEANTPEDVKTFIKGNYPRLTDEQLSEMIDLYPGAHSWPAHGPYFYSAAKAYADSAFVCGGTLLSSAVAKYVNARKSWSYLYDVEDPGQVGAGLGVPHGAEIPAIFGVRQDTGGEGSSLEAENSSILHIVMSYYLSFVQTLNPNKLRAMDAPRMDPFDPIGGIAAKYRLVIETNNTRMERLPARQVDRCAAWLRLHESMQQ